MNVLLLLAIILFVLMIVIGGRKGARSFISLFLNFLVVMFAVWIMTDPHTNPIILTIIACTIISSINLFYINQVNSKTITAFIATIVTIIILIIFIYIITKKAMIQGFGEEEVDEISIFSLYLGVDFVKVGAAVIIMSTIGAITDVSISITSPMREVFRHHPNISQKDLFFSGLTIGRDILGSNTNTLFFAFIGGYMGLLLWFKDLSYSFGQIANSKVFSAEMITIFCAGIGIALIVPIAAWINAFYLVKRREKANTT
ncbi:YibE/F family protein [Virgibacillus sp. MSJ-26]|uniref:YibE/F family protein n=1 Tax=Virgibacillus sp. MSJ-26 TaxID=2841522 RepID=UPI001C1023C1|nr:YibE/F family protein [Virgibacillus sp. MSJ-26]MBU5465697.1 YibE/F family protein [Virgibacillus sp. MSJ-26]